MQKYQDSWSVLYSCTTTHSPLRSEHKKSWWRLTKKLMGGRGEDFNYIEMTLMILLDSKRLPSDSFPEYSRFWIHHPLRKSNIDPKSSYQLFSSNFTALILTYIGNLIWTGFYLLPTVCKKENSSPFWNLCLQPVLHIQSFLKEGLNYRQGKVDTVRH